MHGFYEQPKNTIEVLFLGASTIISGVTPIEVHEPIISLKSGGVDSGNIASVRINNIEYAAPQAGINVIIYDKATEMVADKQIFSAAQTVENK